MTSPIGPNAGAHMHQQTDTTYVSTAARPSKTNKRIGENYQKENKEVAPNRKRKEKETTTAQLKSLFTTHRSAVLAGPAHVYLNYQ